MTQDPFTLSKSRRHAPFSRGNKMTLLAASVAVSTVTCRLRRRGQRTPVANNAIAIREALEAQGIRIYGGRRGRVVQDADAGRSASWTANALDWRDWRSGVALGTGGQAAELVSRLILLSMVQRRRCAFRPMTVIQRCQGWDGVCDAPSSSTYTFRRGSRFGRSRCTAGPDRQESPKTTTTSVRPNPLGVDPLKTCFIFFTSALAAEGSLGGERRKEGKWHDVRVIDGDVLVNWLELYPGVAEWLAIRVNRRPKRPRNLAEVWSEWSLATVPALSQVDNCRRRSSNLSAMAQWGRKHILHQAESANEAIAFLYAAVGQLPLNRRSIGRSPDSRCPVGRRRTSDHRPRTEADRRLEWRRPWCRGGARQRRAPCVRRIGSNVGSPRSVMRLPRPWRHTIGHELEEMGLAMLDARRFAGLCGRSLTVHRRMLTASPVARPAWTRSPVPSSLIAAMLAGAWRRGSSGRSQDRRTPERPIL